MIEAADDPIILNNGLLQVVLSEQGLVKIHDQSIDRTVELAKDNFWLTVDGNTIESGSIVPTVKRVNDTTVIYAYQSGKYSINVVYQLQEGWRFVSKQLLLTGPADSELLVEKVRPFEGKLGNVVADPFRLNGDRDGISLRR